MHSAHRRSKERTAVEESIIAFNSYDCNLVSHLKVKMTAQEGKGKKTRLPSLLKVNSWRKMIESSNFLPSKISHSLPKLGTKERLPNVTEPSLKNEEPSPTSDKWSSVPVASLTPDLQENRIDSASLHSKTERELNELFISSQGMKLTAAAKELNDEEWRLLYEDIFKPLDFYSILHERSKKLS